MRVTVEMIVGLVALGYSYEQISEAYPYLEADDIREALQYAAWRVEEQELSLEVEDLLLLRAAKTESKPNERKTLAEVMKEFGS